MMASARSVSLLVHKNSRRSPVSIDSHVNLQQVTNAPAGLLFGRALQAPGATPQWYKSLSLTLDCDFAGRRLLPRTRALHRPSKPLHSDWSRKAAGRRNCATRHARQDCPNATKNVTTTRPPNNFLLSWDKENTVASCWLARSVRLASPRAARCHLRPPAARYLHCET
jgi:hypothetical protein